jgi:hypothetical protein
LVQGTYIVKIKTNWTSLNKNNLKKIRLD